jgi:hypothetical protein
MTDLATVRLFSYGTLQQENVQKTLFGRTFAGTPDALPSYASRMLEITDPDVLATSGERFHPVVIRTGDPQDRVPGTVFVITTDELAAADRYEVSDYRRDSVVLASGTEAWAFIRA